MITKELIKRVAANSCLSLSDKEIEELLPQLEEILKAFAELDKADVKGVQPAFQPIPVTNISREDKTGRCASREAALGLTKHKRNGYFVGPKVF